MARRRSRVTVKLNKTKNPKNFVIVNNKPLLTKPKKGTAIKADAVILCDPPTSILFFP